MPEGQDEEDEEIARASIGTVTFDETAPDAEATFGEADRAMYAAKRRKTRETANAS